MNTYKKTQIESDIFDMEKIKEKVRDTLLTLTMGALFTAGGIAIIDHFAIVANANAIEEVRTNMATTKDIERIRADIEEIKESQNRLLDLHIQNNN